MKTKFDITLRTFLYLQNIIPFQGTNIMKFKFTYIPTDNMAFSVPVFKNTTVNKCTFVGICYVDFHPSEMKNGKHFISAQKESTAFTEPICTN